MFSGLENGYSQEMDNILILFRRTEMNPMVYIKSFYIQGK